MEMGAMNLKDKLTIELKPDDKKGFLRYGDYVFNAKVCLAVNRNRVLVLH